jgi:hypothetical protein
LQAIQQSQKSGEVRLFCPLFATVDYRGQRLSCQSVIEGISNSTLVMGSKNGGMNVQAGDDEAREVVNDIGKMLNLRPHLVLDRATKTKVLLYTQVVCVSSVVAILNQNRKRWNFPLLQTWRFIAQAAV